jgi:hypothetical protein
LNATTLLFQRPKQEAILRASGIKPQSALVSAFLTFCDCIPHFGGLLHRICRAFYLNVYMTEPWSEQHYGIVCNSIP